MDLINNQSKVTPKDFFLYLGMIAALYVSVGSLLKLVFDIINTVYPDALSGSYYDPYSTAMRLAMASLIIVFPIYLWISYYLSKQVRSDESKKNLWIRKWLIYLTLFIAGVVIVGDLIVLINIFLNGEITTRFVLKVLAVLLVAGSVFGGYGYIVKVDRPKAKVVNTLLISTLIIVLLSIISGFMVIGSPVTARKIKFDSERVSNLQNLQWRVVEYWQAKGSLPAELSLVEDSISGFRLPLDPVTGIAYEYQITGPLSFELCADFALANLNSERLYSEARSVAVFGKSSPFVDGGENWQHDAGQTCFARTIDPDFYSPDRS